MRSLAKLTVLSLFAAFAAASVARADILQIHNNTEVPVAFRYYNTATQTYTQVSTPPNAQRYYKVDIADETDNLSIEVWISDDSNPHWRQIGPYGPYPGNHQPHYVVTYDGPN